MKILALSEHFRLTRGGSVTYVRNVCRQLAEQGHEVYLVTEQDSQTYQISKHWQHFEGYLIRSANPNSSQDVGTRVGVRKFRWEVQAQINDLLSEVQPDVVHVLQGMYLARILAVVPKNYPRIWTIQNVPPQEYAFTQFESFSALNKAVKYLYFELARSRHSKTLRELPYDRLICVSEQTRRFAVAAGAPPDRTVVIPDGINPEMFLPQFVDRETRSTLSSGTPLIVSAAGVAPSKGQSDVIEAMATIIEHFPHAHYVNIGAVRDARYFEAVQSRVKELQLSDHCKFLGHVTLEEIRLYYNACDLYVQPSHQEGFCMAALEAVSCGKPIVGTRTGAIPDFVEAAKAGITVEPNRPEELARAMLKALESQSRQDAEAQHAYVADNYSWYAVAQKTVALYDDVRLRHSASPLERANEIESIV